MISSTTSAPKDGLAVIEDARIGTMMEQTITKTIICSGYGAENSSQTA